jgi:transposase-like protein
MEGREGAEGAKESPAMTRGEKREYWGAVVAEQGVSGEGVGAFCARKGIRASQFYWWRRQLREGCEAHEGGTACPTSACLIIGESNLVGRALA